MLADYATNTRKDLTRLEQRRAISSEKGI